MGLRANHAGAPGGDAAEQERGVTEFLHQIFGPMIFILALLAALINFSVAVSRRKYPMVALVRALAGLVSLALSVAIILNQVLVIHVFQRLDLTNLSWSEVFIATGVFVFLVLWFPSYVERGSQAPARPSIQERAVRPANATVRLQRTGPDEWMN